MHCEAEDKTPLCLRSWRRGEEMGINMQDLFMGLSWEDQAQAGSGKRSQNQAQEEAQTHRYAEVEQEAITALSKQGLFS